MYSSISEKEHQLLLDSIKDHAIFMLDTEGNINSWNEGAARLKGYEEEEVLGKHFRMLFLPEDKDWRPESEMRKALDTGKYEEDWWRVRKDGSKFWAHVVLQPVFDDNNQHIGFSKITTDLTQEKRTQDLNNFLMNEVSGYAIFLLDNSGKVIKWSKAAENIMGFTEKEMMGKSLSIVYMKLNGVDNEAHVAGHLAKAREGRYEEEDWKVRKNGSYFWANYIITPFHNHDGYVVMIRDLTDKKAFEQERAANAALAASNKQLERLAFVSSHHLKEPARKISMFCTMLKADSPKQEKLLDKILVSCKRMTKLLDDILELSHVTPHQDFEKADLNVLLQNVIETLEEEIKEKQITIRYNSLPSAVVIPGQVEQLLTHLLGNAFKFCKDNQPPVVIIEGDILPKERLHPEMLNTTIHSNQYLQIRVQDNGIGFGPEHSSNIFDLFDRLHGNTDYEGTGVGLAICKRVAENHGGNITAYSEKGKGTLFVVTLPFYDE